MKNVIFNLLYFLICGFFFACAEDTPVSVTNNKTSKSVNSESQKSKMNSYPSTKKALVKLKVDVYLENSGSMDGYIAGKEFKNVIYGYLSDVAIAKNHNIVEEMNLFYINKDVLPQTSDLNKFINNLDVEAFKHLGGKRNSTDIAELLDTVLNRTKSSKLSILISDFIFSPGKGNNAEDYLENQKNTIKMRIDERITKDKNFAVCVYKFESQFEGKYFDKNDKPSVIKEKRPFYVWLLGNKFMIKKLKKEIPDSRFGDKLKNMLIFEPMNQNIDYKLSNKSNYMMLNGNKELTNFIKDGEGKYSFFVKVDVSKLLQGKSYFEDKSSYVHNKTIDIDRIKYSDGVLQLKLVANMPNPAEYSIKFESSLPQWVNESNDNVGERALMGKTYGFKYLIDGVYEAFTYKSKMYSEIKISVK